MATGGEENRDTIQNRPSHERDLFQMSASSPSIEAIGSIRVGMLCAAGSIAAFALTSKPSVQRTTSDIQCFIMIARSAPLSPLPYAATGRSLYSKPSQYKQWWTETP